MNARLAAAVLCLTFAGQPASAQPISTAQGMALGKLFEGLASDGAPGCAVEVHRDNQTVFSRAFGLANLEWRIPIRASTVFEAGSVSKQFTAAAVAILSLQGKLSLDDDVRRYLPELPDYGTPITLRHMLTHTSGLRDWTDIEDMNNRPRTWHVHTNADVLRIMARQKVLNFKPGTEFLYSSSNYNLLALVVERASGMSFAEFTARTLFKPLNLTHTEWRDDFTRTVEGRAEAYARSGEGKWSLDMPFENVVGAGGLLTTVSDLMSWNEALANPKPENAAWVALLHQRGKLADGRPIPYAFGLYTLPLKGEPIIVHGGATGGYRAFLGRMPSKSISVAILCNSDRTDTSVLGTRLLGTFVDASPAAVAATLAAARATLAPIPIQTGSAPAQDMASMAGIYSGADSETVFTAKVTDGKLELTDQMGNKALLAPLGVDAFRVPGSPWAIIFTRNAAGDITGFDASTPSTRNLRFDHVVTPANRR